MEFNFDTDEHIKRLFEIAVYFMRQYFDYTEEDAISLVNRYYQFMPQMRDFYHHDGPFHVAVQIHYFVGLGQNPADFPVWRLEQKLLNTPIEARGYMIEHYFSK